MGDITGLIICFVVVLYGTLGFAWVLLFRLWIRHFHRKPISGANQRIKLLGWMSFLAFVIFYTLWAIGVFAPF